MTPNVVADIWVSLAAAAGLWLFHRTLLQAGQRGDDVRSFLFGVRVLGVLVLARTIHWATGSYLAGAVTLLAAALVPLAALLLTENLRKQHAPRPLKWAVLAVALVFGLAAFVPLGPGAHAWRMPALLIAQTGCFVAIGWFALTRRGAGQGTYPRQRATEWLAVAVAVALPLLATDYRIGPWADIPVRMGGLAILVLCWLGAALPRAHSGQREALVSLGLFAATASVAGAAIASTSSMDLEGWVRTGVLALAIGMVAAIAIELRRARTEAARQGLVDGLTDGDLANTNAFLHALNGRAAAMGGKLWRGEDLHALDKGALQAAFVRDRLRTPTDTPAGTEVNWAEEHLSFLRTASGATHLALVGTNPAAVLAMSPPDPLSTTTLERDLRAALRIATLLEKTHP
jgi:hypothetical protein